MENSFFIMSKALDGGRNVTITRLQICTWNIICGDACLEIGIEIQPGILRRDQDHSVSFFAEWLDESCKFISLHDKFSNHDNVRFVFNETEFSSSPIDDYIHNGARISFGGNSRRKLAILPAVPELSKDGSLNISFKNKAKENESPYLRILIKSKLKTFAMIKNGIAKNTYIFDIKVNERRNLPNLFLDTVNGRDLTYCKIEKVFCLHAFPVNFEISFIDSTKLKNIRLLEKTAFKEYLPEINPPSNKDYIITFSKDVDQNQSSYSFFSVFTKETIGAPQIILAITTNIICSLLFAGSALRVQWNPTLIWYQQLPAEYILSLIFLIAMIGYILFRRIENK